MMTVGIDMMGCLSVEDHTNNHDTRPPQFMVRSVGVTVMSVCHVGASGLSRHPVGQMITNLM
jgi:hypothetical protein